MTDGLFNDDAYTVAPGFHDMVINPRDVACPTCGAGVGSPCKRPSGHQLWGGASHAPRIETARRDRGPWQMNGLNTVLSEGAGTLPRDDKSVEPRDRPPT